LKEVITGIMIREDERPLLTAEQGPTVYLVVGVNGVGKTTTIAKLAYRFKAQGLRVMLVAADTFRAAAVDQLQVWANRIGVEIIKHHEGADPAAVVYDGMKAAVARKVDVVIIDTAGRLHTKNNLMEEVAKIRRITGRELPGAPHEVLLVLDATTGQNAISQAKLFQEATGVTGIVLTKLDGTAKGGIVIAIARELNIPVKLIGVGEGMEDLEEYSGQEFAEALFAQ
jgi:fused signal recognition particle receptor